MTYSIDHIRKIAAPIFQENGVETAILFGSYAKGCATEYSDIDIVVRFGSPRMPFDYWGVLEDLSEALHKRIELFNIEEFIPGGKADPELKKTGIISYERVK